MCSRESTSRILAFGRDATVEDRDEHACLFYVTLL